MSVSASPGQRSGAASGGGVGTKPAANTGRPCCDGESMPGNNNFTRNTSQEDDESIAKKMFFGGCFGLPWLWAVNVWHYRRHLFSANADSGVQYWIRRSLTGCVIATVALITWIITFQLNWRSWGGRGRDMLLFVPDDQVDGWKEESWAQRVFDGTALNGEGNN